MLTKKVFRLPSIQPLPSSISDQDFEKELKALEADANQQSSPSLPTFSVKKSPAPPRYASSYMAVPPPSDENGLPNKDFVALDLKKSLDQELAASADPDALTDVEDQSQPLFASSPSSHASSASANASGSLPAGAQQSCGKDCESGKCGVPSNFSEFAREVERKKAEQDAKVDQEFEEMRKDGTLTGYVFRRDYYGLSLRLSQPGVNPNELDARQEHTVLHHACYQQELPMIQLLLARRADANSRNLRGETPLMWACKTGHMETLRVLVSCGADVNARDHNGLTPLLHAAERGQEACMAFLCHGHHVDICQQDTKQKNALHWASWGGHVSAVQWLISQGCDRNVLDEKSCYALHWAAAQGHEKVVNALISYTAQPHHVGESMVSPMKYNVPLRTLVANQLRHKNADGLTPREFCVKRQNELESFLRLPHEACRRTLLIGEYRYRIDNLFLGLFSGLSELVFLLGGPLSVFFLIMYVCGLFSVVNFLDFWLIEFAWLKILFYACMAGTLYNWILVVYGEPGSFSLDTEVTFEHEDAAGHMMPHQQPGSVVLPLGSINGNGNGNVANAIDESAGEMKMILSSGNTTESIQSRHNSSSSSSFSVTSARAPSPTFAARLSSAQTRTTVHSLHSLYIHLLTKPSTDLAPVLQREQPNICITCRIVRPVRSKHCPICNRCVHKFDHHCPFFGTDIAAGTYTPFLQFLVCIILSIICMLAMFVIAVFNMRVGLVHVFVEMKAVTYFHLHFLLYLLMASLLLAQHIRLLITNTTTNEYMNWTRYSYMRDRYGSFFNPFNMGCMSNYKRACCWYPIEPATVQYSRVTSIPQFIKEYHGICGVDLSMQCDDEEYCGRDDGLAGIRKKNYFQDTVIPDSTEMASPRDRRHGYVSVTADELV